jgi:uncharacterized membrane protein
MDVLSLILLVIILIILLNTKWSINDKFRQLEQRIADLQNRIRMSELERKTAEAPKPEVKPVVPLPTVEVKVTEPVKPQEIKVPEPPKPVVTERHPEVISDSLSAIKRPVKTWEPLPQPPHEPKPSFFERYPDLEKFIGENLVNKIGIAILVLAIGFFVKYAIDNNWIGPIGRVGIGILCGSILVGFAHRLRKGYKAFSSVLAGGGIAIFYFSITLAYQQFHLFTQLVALVIMIVITIFAVALSLLYDKEELAVIALIGGFASPFLLSNGTANYNGLFIYLLILNAGLLIIAYFKAWRTLNISSFALSVIVFATVMSALSPATYYIGFRYATLFYLLFFTINIINNIRESKKFIAIDFTILLINTALYFAAGLYLLTVMHQAEFRGLFSVGLAALNLVLSFILFRNQRVDPNVLYLLIGITLTFLSLTAPIQLHGNNITLFWTSEAVLLYWLYQKSSIKLIKLTSLVIWLAMIVSLLMDINNIYADAHGQLTIIANKGFITVLFSAIGSYLLYVLIKKDPQPEIYGVQIVAGLYRVIAFVLLFLSGVLEINRQLVYYYPGTDLNILYLMLYTPAFVCLFRIISGRINKDANWVPIFVLLACAMGLYLLCTPVYFDQLQQMLAPKGLPVLYFAGHWISDLVMVAVFYYLVNLCCKNLSNGAKNTVAWLLSAAIVFFLSTEICLLCEMKFYSGANTLDELQTVYIKTGLPILWGISSFTLMWLGMRNKQRNLRIISLTLFSITLVKLFLFDINHIPIAGKIAAFFCLGVLLLIVSFMYQKVKKIIADDEEKNL